MKESIGLFGGTFNPPHIGHIAAACRFYEEACLTKLYVMPTRIPPHKAVLPLDLPEHRYEMARLAFSGGVFSDMNIEVCDYELQSPSTSYTVLTVKHLLAIHHVERISVYVGSDMFVTLEQWKEADVLFRSCIFFAAPRDDESAASLLDFAKLYREKYGADCRILHMDPVPAASTNLRALFSAENDGFSESMTKNYLTEAVYRYIIEKKLYRVMKG